MTSITVNNNTVDLAKPGVILPKDAKNHNYILLKCKHRLKPDEFQAVAAKKVEVLRLVEDKTYLCKYEPIDLTVLERELPFVEKALVYARDFVIAPSVKAILNQEDNPQALLAFTIILHRGSKDTGDTLLKELERLSKDVQVIDKTSNQLRARFPRNIVPNIAELDCVETIEETKNIESRVARASEVLKAGVSLQTNPAFQGEGEIIAIADHGFDIGEKDNVHPAFLTKTEPKKSRVLDVVDMGLAAEMKKISSTTGYTGLLRDVGGHGTHVAGCALGYLDDTRMTKNNDPNYVNQLKSPAPQAQLYFQAIAPGENVIPNMEELFRTPAKIHSNSWGARSVGKNQPQEMYTQAESFLIDAAMHDNQELLIVWSAGNDGRRWQTLNGKPVYRQVGDLAAAKNAIVVGATYNNRRMKNSDTDCCVDDDQSNRGNDRSKVVGPNVCADLSSKGPTTDFRIKPDVVAPGIGILSALTRAVKPNNAIFNYETGKFSNTNFCWMNGTSQAAPLVAGCAAVIREALKTTGKVMKPSGALVKAIFINGAIDLAGSKYEVDNEDQLAPSGKAPAAKKVFIDMPPAPNPIQGFGRVDLQRSLLCVYPPSPKYGGFEEVELGKEPLDAWRLKLDVPKGLPVLRVTLVYTDPPGNVVHDLHHLAVETQNEKNVTLDFVKPDLPCSPDYEDKANPPKYTVNNVQKVTLKPGPAKVVITVITEYIDLHSNRKFALAYFFDKS